MGILQHYIAQQNVRLQQQRADQAHEEAMKQLEELHGFHTQQNEIQKQQMDLQKAITAQQLKNAYMEHIASGVISPPSNSQVAGQGGGTVTTSFDPQSGAPSISATPLTKTGNIVDLTKGVAPEFAGSLAPADSAVEINTPEVQGTLAGKKTASEMAVTTPALAAQTGAVTSAQVNAQMPLVKAKNDAEIALQNIKDKAAYDRTVVSVAGREQAARITAASRERAAQINANNKTKIDPDEIAATVTPATLGLGELAPAGSANGMHQRAVMAKAGLVQFDKKAGDNLNLVHDFDGVINDMVEVANQLSNNLIGRATTAVQQLSPLPTKLQNKINNITGRAPLLVRGVYGINNGRITNLEINAVLNDMVNGKQSKDMALENIAKIRRDIYGTVYDTKLGSIQNIEQRVAILKAHGLWDAMQDATIPTSFNDKTHEVGRRPVIAVDPKTGKTGIWDPRVGQYAAINHLLDNNSAGGQ